MTPETNDAGTGGAPDEVELGTPIDALRGIEYGLDDRFGARVRGRIGRRLLAVDMLEFFWYGPVQAFIELLRWPFDNLGSGGNDKPDGMR